MVLIAWVVALGASLAVIAIPALISRDGRGTV
jgi:hypothetical protein